MSNEYSDFSMIDLFRIELENNISVLSDGLLALEKDTEEKEWLEKLMRSSHSIKGAARIVQLDPVVNLAHKMEDYFVNLQEGKLRFNTTQIDKLFEAIDSLKNLSEISVKEIETWVKDNSDEFERLTSLLDTLEESDDEVVPEVENEKIVNPENNTDFDKQVKSEENKKVVEAEDRASVVRVTAENLDSLMGLAGEFFVEVGYLEPYSKSLLHLKKQHDDLSRIINKINESLDVKLIDINIKNYYYELRNKQSEINQSFIDRINEFESFAMKLPSLSDQLSREVVKIRMRPFNDGVHAFSRMMRDLAKKLGKNIMFVISGKSTEVDRDILEKLEAPLNHILRNSVDHGIESPDERKALNKPQDGLVEINAYHKSGMLIVQVSDDGRGVDYSSLRDKIIKKNLATADVAQTLNDSELLEFMFLPGFSTTNKVSEISGRGVGLDVVQNMVYEVGGVVRVSSETGKGTTMTMQLPLTLSVIRTLLVDISGEPYAFPISRIDHCFVINTNEINIVEGRQYFNYDNKNIGLVDASQVLGFKSQSSESNSVYVILIGDSFTKYGLVVDSLIGEKDIVVQRLDKRLGKVKNISAASTMADGSPLLIVDVEDLMRSIENILLEKRLRSIDKVDRQFKHKIKSILVVDDSITVREMERKILENYGYHVDSAVNGVDGWNAVRTGSYDLVVTDIDMPRMNGFELTTHIKNDQRLMALPVIIVSYKDSEADRLKGLDAGANYYLTKSNFFNDKLVNSVIDLIGEP